MMCLAKRLRAHEQKVGALNLQRDIPAVPGDMGDGDGDELFGDDDGAGDAEAWDDAAADLAVSLPPPARLNRGLPLSAAQQQQQQQLLLLQQQQQQQQLLAAQAQANGVALFQHPGWQVPHATVNPVPQWMPQQLAQRLRDPQRMAVLQELRMVHQRWAQLAQYLAMHDHEQARAAALRDTLKAVNSATRGACSSACVLSMCCTADASCCIPGGCRHHWWPQMTHALRPRTVEPRAQKASKPLLQPRAQVVATAAAACPRLRSVPPRLPLPPRRRPPPQPLPACGRGLGPTICRWSTHQQSGPLTHLRHARRSRSCRVPWRRLGLVMEALTSPPRRCPSIPTAWGSLSACLVAGTDPKAMGPRATDRRATGPRSTGRSRMVHSATPKGGLLWHRTAVAGLLPRSGVWSAFVRHRCSRPQSCRLYSRPPTGIRTSDTLTRCRTSMAWYPPCHRPRCPWLSTRHTQRPRTHTTPASRRRRRTRGHTPTRSNNSTPWRCLPHRMASVAARATQWLPLWWRRHVQPRGR